jgi:hypothetical protein
MGYNTRTTSNSGTPVGNNWMDVLNQGLQTGNYGAPTNPQPSNNPNGTPGGTNGRSRGNSGVGSGNPGGGTGVPPANPGAGPSTTGGFYGAINNALNSDPSSMTYNNPNNQRPVSYTPTNVGVQTPGADTAINTLNRQIDIPTYNFNAINNPGASNLFNQAQQGQMSISDQMRAQATSAASNPYGQAGSGPGAPGVSAFSSNGLLGDRGGVTDAITNRANLLLKDQQATNNARFTANGGMAFGTPAAYANSLTAARGAEGLASSLATADLGYRNSDINAYTAENTARQNQFATEGSIYGNQLQAVNAGRNTSGQMLTGAANTMAGVAGGEFNQQGMGFNYDQLRQTGDQATQDRNLRAGLGFNELINSGAVGAGNLAINQGTLNQNAQIANNNNSYNAGQQALQGYTAQGTLDQNAQNMGYNNQQNYSNQLFNSYNNAYNRGTPQAENITTPNTGMNLLNAGTQIASAALGRPSAQQAPGPQVSGGPPTQQQWQGALPSPEQTGGISIPGMNSGTPVQPNVMASNAGYGAPISSIYGQPTVMAQPQYQQNFYQPQMQQWANNPWGGNG